MFEYLVDRIDRSIYAKVQSSARAWEHVEDLRLHMIVPSSVPSSSSFPGCLLASILSPSTPRSLVRVLHSPHTHPFYLSPHPNKFSCVFFTFFYLRKLSSGIRMPLTPIFFPLQPPLICFSSKHTSFMIPHLLRLVWHAPLPGQLRPKKVTIGLSNQLHQGFDWSLTQPSFSRKSSEAIIALSCSFFRRPIWERRLKTWNRPSSRVSRVQHGAVFIKLIYFHFFFLHFLTFLSFFISFLLNFLIPPLIRTIPRHIHTHTHTAIVIIIASVASKQSRPSPERRLPPQLSQCASVRYSPLVPFCDPIFEPYPRPS